MAGQLARITDFGGLEVAVTATRKFKRPEPSDRSIKRRPAFRKCCNNYRIQILGAESSSLD